MPHDPWHVIERADPTRPVQIRAGFFQELIQAARDRIGPLGLLFADHHDECGTKYRGCSPRCTLALKAFELTKEDKDDK